jgi:phage anti-repressor protein
MKVMDKETFIDLIERMKATAETINQAYQLKIDLIEFSDQWEQIITILLKELFTEEGYDWISWWAYEDGREAWEKDGTPIPMDTAEDLYNYLKKEGYLK